MKEFNEIEAEAILNELEHGRGEFDACIKLAKDYIKIHAKLEKAEAELSDIRTSEKFILSEDCPTDEVHCGCVPTLKRELAELRERKCHQCEGYVRLIREIQTALGRAGKETQAGYVGRFAEGYHF